jgi:hypothetical protein
MSSSSEYIEAKIQEVEEMGKDINLAINILKKA